MQPVQLQGHEEKRAKLREKEKEGEIASS